VTLTLNWPWSNIGTAHRVIILDICAELFVNPTRVSKYIEQTKKCDGQTTELKTMFMWHKCLAFTCIHYCHHFIYNLSFIYISASINHSLISKLMCMNNLNSQNSTHGYRPLMGSPCADVQCFRTGYNLEKTYGERSNTVKGQIHSNGVEGQICWKVKYVAMGWKVK